MSSSLSSDQFGFASTPKIDAPLSLSAQTSTTFQRQTAWRSPHSGGTPLSYSAKNAGSTFKFDEPSSSSFEKK